MTTRRIAIIFGLAVLILLAGVILLNQKEEKGISLKEKQLIENWILENNLNQYGDPKDTAYIGGTRFLMKEQVRGLIDTNIS